MRDRNFSSYALADWLAHIQAQHWRSIDLRLDRIARVWENLRGRRSRVVITVVGTNGKGSCVAMLEAVLRDAGLRTGSYTSPHLVRYNERVRIDGRAVDDASLCRAFSEIERVRDDVPLTYFEFGTLCALYLFQQRRVDVSLLEAGMGGRLDAVNLIDNDLALITSIGIDHARWLGSNRAAIATEKAGILKENALAVCADPNPPKVIARIAAERNCLLLQHGADYRIEEADGGILWHARHPAVADRWKRLAGLRQPLHGERQLNNLGGVVAALALTCAHTGVTPADVVNGLPHTRLTARCQIFGDAPETVLDVAHNRESAEALAAFLGQRKISGETHAVFGVLADKCAGEIAAAVNGVIDHWHLATLEGERGQSAETLRGQLAGDGVGGIGGTRITTYHNPIAAYRSAVVAAQARGRVVVFGSFHTVGDIIAHFEHDRVWAADVRE